MMCKILEVLMIAFSALAASALPHGHHDYLSLHADMDSNRANKDTIEGVLLYAKPSIGTGGVTVNASKTEAELREGSTVVVEYNETAPTIATTRDASHKPNGDDLRLRKESIIGVRPKARVLNECMQKPTSLTFLFTGNRCSEDSNSQPDQPCVDVDSVNRADPANIIVSTTGGVVYFDDFVNEDDEFQVTADATDGTFDDILNVQLGLGGESRRSFQNLRLKVSCDDGTLSLGDSFGGITLVEFTNNNQGTVDNIVEVDLEFVVDDPDPFDVDLDQLTLTDNVNSDATNEQTVIYLNRTVSSGTTFSITETRTIDLTTSQDYEIDATITGETNSLACEGTTLLMFTAGGKMP